MAHIVHLELKAVAKGLCVGRTLLLLNQNSRMNVTIATLRPCDSLCDPVHTSRQLGVTSRFKNGTGALNPLVKVPIVERCPPMPAFNLPGRNPEILVELAVVRAIHDRPKFRQHMVPGGLETLRP